ncbi:hypothetical protein QJQ45_007234 [Haematococcus lacustris]|nr:hypothetical protein QJQ45_007234 [Haematococcus lacustris]
MYRHTTVHGKPKSFEKATARLNAHRVMVKKKRKGTDKHKNGPPKKPKASRSAQGKQRQERRDGWNTCRRQVIKVSESAVLRGCKKTKRKIREHLQLRAEVRSQLRVIASLFVLRIFLTCLVGYPSPGYRSAPDPPAVQPPLGVLMRCCGPAARWCWKSPAGQVDPRLLRPAWSQRRDQPVRGMMWCPVVAPCKPPQAPRSSQAATPAAASAPGPSTSPPAKRSKRTEAEQAAEPSQPTKGKGKAQGKAAKAKPAPQPGRWVDRDCNAALNMQRIGESRWRPLELCFWPDQGALPAKGKEYPGLGYKRLRDKPPKAQEQQQQPAEAQ